MNNTWRFGEKEIEYVREVLGSGFASSTSGNMCLRFEQAYAEKVGSKYAVTFNSGTSTMHSSLAAAGIGPGDEVIVPALTVISTANAVIHQTAIPIFADIDENTFNIDPKDIERKITPRTKAIIPVALYGLSPDMDAIMKIAEKHKLFVLVDAAEAHMAQYKGKNIANLGHVTSFSLENSKQITCGEGGLITTSDPILAANIRKHGCQGFKNVKAADGRVRIDKDVFQDPDYKRHDSLGWNYRMPEVCAAVALAQLEKIDLFISLRLNHAKLFTQAIKETGCDFLTPQYVPEGYVNTYWTFTCKFNAEKAGVSWKEFRKRFVEFGGDGIYAAWAPVYLEPVYQEMNFFGKGWPNSSSLTGHKVEYKKGMCPVVERVQPTLMQFVNNYGSDKEAMVKVDALKKAILSCMKK